MEGGELMSKHYIEMRSCDWWVCLCGNEPIQECFSPCDELGQQVEPTPEDWTTSCYVCDRCGRITDQDAGEVVGQRQDDE